VTEKLLTGFDAPILYCIYLDKPMRDHVLLQAIARVNRPYEDTEGRRKTAGFILDFVGIFDNLERALAFDSEDVSGVVEGIDVLKAHFAELIARGKEEYLPIGAGMEEDKAAEAVLEHFRDQEEREGFYAFYRELEELYEILSPDPFLRDHVDDYEGLTRIYYLLRAAYEPSVSVDRGFLRKTADLVKKHTITPVIFEPKDEHDLTPETLERLAKQGDPDTVRVFNLLKTIRKIVEEKGVQLPYLVPIGERAEAVAEAFEERQDTTQEALRKLYELAEEYERAEEDRKKSDLPDEAFAVFWYLKSEGVAGAEKVAREASAAFSEHPYWRQSESHEREVRTALYKALLSAGVKNVVKQTNDLFTMLRGASS